MSYEYQDLENRRDKEGAKVITMILGAFVFWLLVIAGTAVIKIV